MPAQIQFLDGPRALVLALGEEPLVVGGRGNAVRVAGSTVTRQHARFLMEGGRHWIEGLGGDGVRVNGAMVQRARLSNRDRIQIGPLEIVFFED